MPKYKCPRCGYETTDKSRYMNHLKRKNICDNINSDEYYWLKEKLLSKLDIKSLIRAKANLYPSAIKLNNHDLHSDFEYSHKGAIYYLNTNNGYTNFEDGTKIESVANRIMFFDSSTLHNSTDCTDNKYRLNININYF